LCWLASSSCRLLSWISSNSRTFSIAIEAWSANVVTSSICLSVNVGEWLYFRARQGQDADWDTNAKVAGVSPVPVMLDEPICELADVKRASKIPIALMKERQKTKTPHYAGPPFGLLAFSAYGAIIFGR
jgi:hypothetical protein